MTGMLKGTTNQRDRRDGSIGVVAQVHGDVGVTGCAHDDRIPRVGWFGHAGLFVDWDRHARESEGFGFRLDEKLASPIFSLVREPGGPWAGGFDN